MPYKHNQNLAVPTRSIWRRRYKLVKTLFLYNQRNCLLEDNVLSLFKNNNFIKIELIYFFFMQKMDNSLDVIIEAGTHLRYKSEVDPRTTTGKVNTS